MSQQENDQNNNLSTEADLQNVGDYQLDDDERRRLLDHVERVRAERKRIAIYFCESRKRHKQAQQAVDQLERVVTEVEEKEQSLTSQIEAADSQWRTGQSAEKYWHQQLSRVSEKVDAEEKVNRTEREQKISSLLESAKRSAELIGAMRNAYATYNKSNVTNQMEPMRHAVEAAEAKVAKLSSKRVKSDAQYAKAMRAFKRARHANVIGAGAVDAVATALERERRQAAKEAGQLRLEVRQLDTELAMYQ